MLPNKTTVAQLHEDKMREIKEQEDRLPEMKERLAKLETGLEELSIGERRSKELEIKILRQEINTISSLRINYFKGCGYVLNKYSETERKKTPRIVSGLDILGKKEFNNSINRKNILYRSYRSMVDPTYVHVDENTVNEDNYCFECKVFRVTVTDDSIMVCPKCGNQITVTQKYNKPSVEDPPNENKVYEYQRFTHFCNWIDKIQGKEEKIIPQSVLDSVRSEIYRERKDHCLETLTEKDIRRYLKKHRGRGNTDNYYDHSTKILWLVTGIQPLQMTPEMETNLQNMFMAIQEPFEQNKAKRHNFSSYAYILYKFCQLLGYNEFLPKFKLQKNEGLIYHHDRIWKKICEAMGGEEKGWVFIKTYDY